MVATFDLSAANVDAFTSDHWLQNSLNVVQIWFKDKAYDLTAVPGAGAAHAVAKRGLKRLRV